MILNWKEYRRTPNLLQTCRSMKPDHGVLIREAAKRVMVTLEYLPKNSDQEEESVDRTDIRRALQKSVPYSGAERKVWWKERHVGLYKTWRRRMCSAQIRHKIKLLFVHFWEYYHLEHTISTKKHGDGSIMVWGGFSCAETQKLVTVDGVKCRLMWIRKPVRFCKRLWTGGPAGQRLWLYNQNYIEGYSVSMYNSKYQQN